MSIANNPADDDAQNEKKLKKQTMVAAVEFADDADTSITNVSFYPIVPTENDDADAMIDDFDVVENMSEDEVEMFFENLATSDVFWKSRLMGEQAFVYVTDDGSDGAILAGGSYEKFL